MRKLLLYASLTALATAIFGMAPTGASAYTLLESESAPLAPGSPIELVSTNTQSSDGTTLWISCPKIETTFELEVNEPGGASGDALAIPTGPFATFKCKSKIPGSTDIEFVDYELSSMHFRDDGTVDYSIEPSTVHYYWGASQTKTCGLLATSTVSSSWENTGTGGRLLFDKHLKFSGESCHNGPLSGSFSMTSYGSPVTVSANP